MRDTRSRNVKYLFCKSIAEENGIFNMQLILKGGNKHTRVICDTCSKLSVQVQKQFQFFSF